MELTLLKGKIHRARVTEACLEYEGSISIDADLREAAGLLVHEQVDVLNITNGERFTTYVIDAPRGSRVIGINGAAAHKAHVNDRVIICAYARMTPVEAQLFSPQVVLVNEENIIQKAHYQERYATIAEAA